jgi:cytochrome bd-type quinol oxidase subunit 2
VSFLRHHIGLMFFYAVATGVFFALLWREDRREQIRTFVTIFCALFFGGIAVGWLMYPFPLR